MVHDGQWQHTGWGGNKWAGVAGIVAGRLENRRKSIDMKLTQTNVFRINSNIQLQTTTKRTNKIKQRTKKDENEKKK